MAQTDKYTLENFDYNRASKKKLVAMVNGSNIIQGTGFLKVISPNNLILTVDGDEYTFDSKGNPVSQNAGSYTLKMAISNVEAIEEGAVGETTNAMTRSVNAETGEVSYEKDTSGNSHAITIDSLNARDQFAIQILKSMLEKTQGPDELSKDEITHYCEAAYNWAGYMVKMSSNSRSVIKDEDTTESAKTEEIGYLDSNTDKLLNNLIVELQKTKLKKVESGKDVYYERVTNPDLNAIMERYVAGSTSGSRVGLKDLIAAVSNIEIDSTAIVEAIYGSTVRNVTVSSSGLGGDENHPVYISGGGFPSRQILASEFKEAAINDFLTFNTNGAVGYSTKKEVKKAILGYLNSYSTIDALSTAVYNSIKTTVDNRIKEWLQAAKVTVDGTDYSITVNTPA